MKATKRTRPIPAPPTPRPAAAKLPTIRCRVCLRTWQAAHPDAAPTVTCDATPCPAMIAASGLSKHLQRRRKWRKRRAESSRVGVSGLAPIPKTPKKPRG